MKLLKIGAVGLVILSSIITSFAEDHSGWIKAMLEARTSTTKMKPSDFFKTQEWRKDKKLVKKHYRELPYYLELQEKYPVEMAWLFQDGEFEKRHIYSGKVKSRYVESPERFEFLFNYIDKKRSSNNYEKKLIRVALDSLDKSNSDLEKKYKALLQHNPANSDPAWLSLYVKICDYRRDARMKLYTDKGPRYIAFTNRHSNYKDPHWYATFGYRVCNPKDMQYSVGGSALAVLDTQTGDVKTLVEDAKGGFRDPVVHFDGKKIMFSWRKASKHNYLLYEINIDGTGLRQITHGNYDDIESIYLPDGDIMFVSSRSKRWVNCWETQVATIHRSDINGKNIKRLSANIEHDNTPWLLKDGRVAYQRWEYVDRSQFGFHHLWVMNPDGTQQQALLGNMNPGNLYIAPKPIPNTNEIVVTACQGHGGGPVGEHRGALAVYPLDRGPDAIEKLQVFTLTDFEDPYPVIDKNWFIAARDKNIFLLSRTGAMEVLYTSDNLPIAEPRPLVAYKRPPVIASRTDWTKTTGQLMLNDVTIGRKMKGIKKGEITQLMVLETLPKPLNWGGGMVDKIGVSYGGSFTVERILGTVPVESDGSANFEVPANRPLVLAALDKDGSLVKRMHSFITVMPGETLSCIGCHEDRTMATPPSRKLPKAYKRLADTIKPLKGIPDIIDYHRDVQPVWDKHCVSCHSNEEPSGGVNLTGDRGILYTQSYMNLRARMEFFLGNNGSGNFEPREVGDAASPVVKKIVNNHHGVKMSQEELMLIRSWINAGGTFTSTYAGLGSGHLFPSMIKNHILAHKFKFPEIKPAHKAIEKNCASCHSGKDTLNLIEELDGFNKQNTRVAKKKRKFIPAKYLQHILYNMTRPEDSRILKTVLAKDAGGFATRPSDTKKVSYNKKGIVEHPVIFKNKDNKDYLAILAYIQRFAEYLKEHPHYYMEDFVPIPEYVREMKRYGVLPKDYDPASKKLSMHEIDDKYFDMTWKDAWPKADRAKAFNTK